ncbi:MAG TPA: universal stress protein [Caulobacteraceae bacterium]|nr:universal stress protein [Caulobacteraceae bacterium]
MYKRILLAYDGSREGRGALREGALIAHRCEAQIYLLSVVAGAAALRMAEGVNAGALAHCEENYREVLEEGVERLKSLGFNPIAKLVTGEPVQEIAAFAHHVGADLIVLGHRRQSLLSRWWSGSSDAYLVDHVNCSVLISRNVISDEAFMAEFAKVREITA